MPTPLDRARALLAELEDAIDRGDDDAITGLVAGSKVLQDVKRPNFDADESLDDYDARLLSTAKSDLAHVERSALVDWTGNPHLFTLQQGAA